MAVNVYECMFIFDPAKFARDAAGVEKEVNEAIAAVGGEMLVSRLWDDRRLAFPIKGNRKAPYWLTYFRLEGQQLTTLERQFRISDSVLRHLVIKIDARISDAVVSHAATSGRKAPQTEERTGGAAVESGEGNGEVETAEVETAAASDGGDD